MQKYCLFKNRIVKIQNCIEYHTKICTEFFMQISTAISFKDLVFKLSLLKKQKS